MTSVHGPDQRRGHISIRDEQMMPLAVLCDVGPWLDMWTHSTTQLTPPLARDLAVALARWAARSHPELLRDMDEALLELFDAEEAG